VAEAIELLPVGVTPPGLQQSRGRRPRPPRHLADLDPDARRAAVAELGQPGFRADQLSRHYFSRLTDDPADMTDLPADIRDSLAGAMLPPLLTAQRELQCDGGVRALVTASPSHCRASSAPCEKKAHGMAALARTPVIAKTTTVGVLSALLRRT